MPFFSYDMFVTSFVTTKITAYKRGRAMSSLYVSRVLRCIPTIPAFVTETTAEAPKPASAVDLEEGM